MQLLKPTTENDDGTVTIWYTYDRTYKITRSRPFRDADRAQWYYHVAKRIRPPKGIDGDCYEYISSLSDWGQPGRAAMFEKLGVILYEVGQEPSPEPHGVPGTPGYKRVLDFHGISDFDDVEWWKMQDNDNYMKE